MLPISSVGGMDLFWNNPIMKNATFNYLKLSKTIEQNLMLKLAKELVSNLLGLWHHFDHHF